MKECYGSDENYFMQPCHQPRAQPLQAPAKPLSDDRVKVPIRRITLSSIDHLHVHRRPRILWQQCWRLIFQQTECHLKPAIPLTASVGNPDTPNPVGLDRWNNASESAPVLRCACALIYLPSTALHPLYNSRYCAVLACELAVGVGCATMGGINTEGNWLGNQFARLFLPRIAARTLANAQLANVWCL
jgi:hypothetical protein